MSTQHYCSAGPLITKARAPKCATCGQPLWAPVWLNPSCWPHRDSNGNRLGYVPKYRKFGAGHPIHWNEKACLARGAKLEAAR